MFSEVLVIAKRKIQAVMAAAALFASERGTHDQQRQRMQVAQLVFGATRLFGLCDVECLQLFARIRQIFSAAHDSNFAPHYVSNFRQVRGGWQWFNSGFRGVFVIRRRIARQRRRTAGQRCAAALCDRRIFDHRLPGARSENQSFEQGIARQAVRTVYAGGGRLARGIQSRKGSAAPEIGLHAAHHVMRGGADRGHVGGEVEAVAGTRLVNSRKALL